MFKNPLEMGSANYFVVVFFTVNGSIVQTSHNRFLLNGVGMFQQMTVCPGHGFVMHIRKVLLQTGMHSYLVG